MIVIRSLTPQQATGNALAVHFYRNVFTVAPKSKVKSVARMLKTIHASEHKLAAREKAETVIKKSTSQKLQKATQIVREGIEDTITYYDFPDAHRRRIRINNPLECILREVGGRTRVVVTFSDGNSALMLVAVRLRQITDTRWEHGVT